MKQVYVKISLLTTNSDFFKNKWIKLSFVQVHGAIIIVIRVLADKNVFPINLPFYKHNQQSWMTLMAFVNQECCVLSVCLFFKYINNLLSSVTFAYCCNLYSVAQICNTSLLQILSGYLISNISQ